MSQNPLVLPTTGTVSGLAQTLNMNQALDTLNTLASGPSAPASPEQWQLWTDTTNNIVKQYNGSAWQPVWFSANGLPAAAPMKFLGGLAITFPSSSTISISTGMATSESATGGLMWNASAITKTINAVWNAGTGVGSLDTGSLTSNTWYHVHLIGRTDTGQSDILVSLNATSPAMPTLWTQRRRIASFYFGSGSINPYEQIGDCFYWTSAPYDVSTSALGTSATLYTLSVPPGVKTIAMLSGSVSATGNAAVLITDPANTDVAPSFTSAGGVTAANQGASQPTSFTLTIPVNTSQQIRARSSLPGTTLNVNTLGWIDYRGQYS